MKENNTALKVGDVVAVKASTDLHMVIIAIDKVTDIAVCLYVRNETFIEKELPCAALEKV
jgi:hypothetical protein